MYYFKNKVEIDIKRLIELYQSYLFSNINRKQPEIIVYRGYPVEVHPVLTEDGYILGK